MSTAVHIVDLHPIHSNPACAGRRGFWRALLARVIDARIRQGEARVRQHVSRLSDEALANFGLSASEIVALRTTGCLLPRAPR